MVWMESLICPKYPILYVRHMNHSNVFYHSIPGLICHPGIQIEISQSLARSHCLQARDHLPGVTWGHKQCWTGGRRQGQGLLSNYGNIQIYLASGHIQCVCYTPGSSLTPGEKERESERVRPPWWEEREEREEPPRVRRDLSNWQNHLF